MCSKCTKVLHSQLGGTQEPLFLMPHDSEPLKALTEEAAGRGLVTQSGAIAAGRRNWSRCAHLSAQGQAENGGLEPPGTEGVTD